MRWSRRGSVDSALMRFGMLLSCLLLSVLWDSTAASTARMVPMCSPRLRGMGAAAGLRSSRM